MATYSATDISAADVESVFAGSIIRCRRPSAYAGDDLYYHGAVGDVSHHRGAAVDVSHHRGAAVDVSHHRGA
ncbi:MAG: hypothetical protein SGI73_21020, partial [Chloroflexota bacterium]|nr:hypothetical protein [Chloroflexota bacterium]